MLFEAIAGGSVIYFAAKNYLNIDIRLKPHAVARSIEKAKQTVSNATEQVKQQLVSEYKWQEKKATQKAQALYDHTVSEIFESATQEEKDTLMEMFKKYAPSDQ